jgi:hypothetical protein
MDSLSAKLYELARGLGPQLLSFITILVCIVVALVRRKRHPKASLFVVLALILLFLQPFVYEIVSVFFSENIIASNAATNDNFYLSLSLVSSLIFVVGLAILLIAVFVDRKPASPRP